MIELLLTLSGLAAVTLLFGDIDSRHRPPESERMAAGRGDPALAGLVDREAGSADRVAEPTGRRLR